MREIIYEVKTYEVEMCCDECGEGLMRPCGNIILTTYPVQYPHQCTKCGHIANYTVKYPYTLTKKIEEK